MRIKVNLKERSYPIIVTVNSFKLLAWCMNKLSLGNEAFIITNAHISRLYGLTLKKCLAKANIRSYFYKVADSEKSKSISEYIRTISKISAIDTKKRLFIIAFGGGVVGDLCGFISATYKRGVNYIQIPTTLLAQVDSAIGGKTAVDLPCGKNLVGAFFQPRLVYSNISLLGSLPQRQIRSGLAEVVKYGIIFDKKLFAYVEKNYKKLLKLDKTSLAYVIACASKIKAHVVSIDEKETKGFRTILNFGHTIGHALETATGYSGLTHGQAISIGMACAAEIASEMGLLGQNSLFRIIDLLSCLKLPTKLKNANLKAVFKAFDHDKKFIHGKTRMVLPTRIGHVIVTEDIPMSIIKNVVKKRIS